MTQRFAQDISRRKQAYLYRSVSLPRGIDLSSNDYLGLSVHPQMLMAAHKAIDECGMIGAAGSRLLRGHHEAHSRLEARAAEIFSAPASLYFSTGFQANYALMTALCSRQDMIIYDEFVHASMRDGIAAAQAKSVRVKHNDLNEFEAALKKANEKRRAGGVIWVACETVYSMDGDRAPIDQLYALAQRYGAYLIADEAHATGVFGENGRGLAYACGQADDYQRLLTVHTCGKALGAAGAIVCGAADVIDYMINNARGFIYSTAPLPLQAACVHSALDLMVGDLGDELRTALFDRMACVSDHGFTAQSQIIPLMIGSYEKAVQIAQALQSRGYDIRAVRPPTVPKGTARLRLSLGAGLAMEDLKAFLKDYIDLYHE